MVCRMHEILEYVQRLAGVRAIFRLDRRRNPRCGLFTADYLVNLKKNDQPFLDRVADFDTELRKALADGEELRYENLSFVITGAGYCLCFALEGYKKRSDKLGYMENGTPKSRMLHRMGVAFAFHHYEMSRYFRAEVESRMLDADWIAAYPNPADRFVFICRRMRNYENNPLLRDLNSSAY